MTPTIMQVKCAALAAGIELHVCSNSGRKIEAIIYDGVSPPVVWQPWLDKYQAMDLAQRVGLEVSWRHDQSIVIGKSPIFVFTDPDKAMYHIVSNAAAQTPVNMENPVRWEKGMSNQDIADMYGFDYVEKKCSDERYNIFYVNLWDDYGDKIFGDYFYKAVQARRAMIKFVNEKGLKPRIKDSSEPTSMTEVVTDSAEVNVIQESLMLFDPATGEEKPYPSSAVQWRNYHGKAAWLYNPWTGKLRDARDIGSDVFGFLIV